VINLPATWDFQEHWPIMAVCSPWCRQWLVSKICNSH